MTVSKFFRKFFEFFEFWIWTNHNSLLSLATNQFPSFLFSQKIPIKILLRCENTITQQETNELSCELSFGRPLLHRMIKCYFNEHVMPWWWLNFFETLGYFLLYNNPSYSRNVIGSRLWSIRGQTHRWRQRSIQVFLNFLNFEFEPITILCQA